MAKSKAKLSRTPLWKRALFISVAAVFALVAIGAFWYLRDPTETPSESALEKWVTNLNFSPLRPIQSEYTPGTLIQLAREGRDQVAMAPETFLGALAQSVRKSKSADVVLNVTYKLEASFSAGEAKVTKGTSAKTGADVLLTAKLTLSDINVLTLPLSDVADAVAVNLRVKEKLKDSPENLFIVLEALQIGRIKFAFTDRVNSETTVRLAEKVLSPTFGGALTFGADGTLISDKPLIVGASLAKLSDVSGALGGAVRTVKVRPFTPTEVETFRSSQVPVRLSSAYDIYSLVVGMGNYPSASLRAGGQLPDAITTAEWVAGVLRQALPSDQANHVQLITSVEESPGTFDRSKRLGRRELVTGIDDFVATVQKRSDPTRETLIVFYYFGHGLADGISRSVFLVPEAFVDNEAKGVTEVASDLLSVADVSARLSKATDRLVLLIDACRAHRNESDGLTKAWKEGLKQSADLGGILAALQFTSGIYGPHPILFGTEDGLIANTVRLPRRGLTNGTGPLAIALEESFRKSAAGPGALTLSAFIELMKQPTQVEQLGTTVRAHTHLRTDFQNELSQIPFLSTTPQKIAERSKRFRPPASSLVSQLGTEPPPRATMRSGAQAKELLRFDSDVVDIACTTESVWVLDNREQVWEITTDGGRRHINPGLPAAAIGMDADLGMLLAQWDEEKIYQWKGGTWRELRAGIRGQRLVSDSANQVWILNDSYAGRITLLPVRPDNDSLRREVTSEELLDAAPAAEGALWLVEAQKVSIISRSVVTTVKGSFWKPTLVRTQGEEALLLSEDGRMLYRLRPSKDPEGLDLFDVGMGDSYLRTFGSRGFAWRSQDRILIGAGSSVVEVDLSGAKWRHIDPQ